jgi:hypothetical protein
MAKGTRTRAERELHTIRMNFPREVWAIITKAAKVAGVSNDQVVGVILALRLVTLKDQP